MATVRIYFEETTGKVVVEGVGTYDGGDLTASTGPNDTVSIFNTALNVYIVHCMPYTMVVNEVSAIFPNQASTVTYLESIINLSIAAHVPFKYETVSVPDVGPGQTVTIPTGTLVSYMSDVEILDTDSDVLGHRLCVRRIDDLTVEISHDSTETLTGITARIGGV